MSARHLTVTATVVLAHAGALWLLQQGLQSRPQETMVAAEVLMDWVAPVPAPTPEVRPQPVAQPKPSPAPPRPQVKPTPPAPPPTPDPALPVTAPVSSEPSPVPVAEVSPPVAVHPTSPSAAPTPAAPSAPPTQTAPAAPRIELPSTQADYLNNPRPAYPPLSKRLGEEGKVVLRVRIEADGRASQAEIHRSSGYERLDQTALQTVLRWRYVPGKRNGVPEAMWFYVPIHFVLE